MAGVSVYEPDADTLEAFEGIVGSGDGPICEDQQRELLAFCDENECGADKLLYYLGYKRNMALPQTHPVNKVLSRTTAITVMREAKQARAA